MNKIVLVLIVTFCIPCFSLAKNIEKEYEKLIKKYDIDQSAKTANSIEEFWEISLSQNERFTKFFKDFQKGTKATQNAKMMLSEAQVLSETYIENLPYISNIDSLQIYLLEDLGVLRGFPSTKIFVINELNEFNAFSCPDGKIFIEARMLQEEDLSYYGLLGICAHEFAHFMLQHVLVEQYETIKREKRNKIIAGVTAGINAAAAIYAATNGVDTGNNIEEVTSSLFESAERDTQKFRYKYSREQEIESDIIAFRFLDYIGVGGEYYIKTLELLDNLVPDIIYQENSDHPSTKYRIGLLRYMKDHPEIIKKQP